MSKITRETLIGLDKEVKQLKVAIKGQELTIDVATEFSKIEIEEFIKTLLSYHEFIESNEEFKAFTLEMLVSFLLLKEFTDLPYNRETKNIEESLVDLIEISSALSPLQDEMTGERIVTLISNSFNPKEVDRITNTIKGMTTVIQSKSR